MQGARKVTHCLLSRVDRRTVAPFASVVVAVPIVDRSMPAIWLKYRSLGSILNRFDHGENKVKDEMTVKRYECFI